MSENLKKIALEINELVDGFVSKAQFMSEPAPMKGGDTNNDFPRSAIQSYLGSQTDATMNKWNQLLDKISDEAYEEVSRSTGLDLKITATLSGNKYIVKIQPEVEPSRNREMERMLQPFMNGLAGVASAKATKAYKSGNSSFGIQRNDHLKFTK